MKRSDVIKTQMNVLRKELYNLISTNATYQEIYDISTQIDALIVVYYKECDMEMMNRNGTYLERQVI